MSQERVLEATLLTEGVPPSLELPSPNREKVTKCETAQTQTPAMPSPHTRRELGHEIRQPDLWFLELGARQVVRAADQGDDLRCRYNAKCQITKRELD